MKIWYVLLSFGTTSDTEVFLFLTEAEATEAWKSRVIIEEEHAVIKGYSIAAAKKDCLIQITASMEDRRTAFFSRVLSTTGDETFIRLGATIL